jgi:hypothetical protein
MRKIWRRTAKLFFGRPTLWIPVFCADFISFCLWQLQGLAAQVLVHWLALHSSLPVYERQLYERQYAAHAMKLAVVTRPFAYATYFLNVCLYVAAFVITAQLVEVVDRNARPNFLEGLGAARMRLRGILGFSLKLCLFYVPAEIVACEGFLLMLKHPLHYDPLTVWTLNSGVGLATRAVVAYCLTPSAILLLCDSSVHSLQRDSKRWGRVFSFVAIIVISAIGYLAGVGEQAFLESHFIPVWHRLEIDFAASLLRAFPYTALFIALSLIATSDAQEPELCRWGQRASAQAAKG